MSIPTLIILAGGASSRMWPLREKSLLRFGPSPLLMEQLRRYQALGFDHAVVVGNPENVPALRQLTAELDGLRVEVVVQPTPNGMGDALLHAAPALALEGGRRAIYITQVHDVTDTALHQAVLAAYRADPDASYLAGVEREAYFPGGYLVVDGQDRITGIIEKPAPDQRPSNLVNLVAHVHHDAARLLDEIRRQYEQAATPDDHYERAMDVLMKDSVFRVVRYGGPWHALKYPWHVLDVMEYALSQIQGQHIHPNAYIHPNAVVSGPVVIEEGARVFAGAAVVGPAYIGRGVIVGNNALVRASMVLDKSEVGFTTEVARSYVGEHCAMHACRVLDSIFASGVNFSAGCTTANLRMDRGEVAVRVKGQKINSGRSKLGAVIGQDAFLSVDVMTMPGVKIGEGAQIGPGTHVHQDVQNRQRVFVRQVIEVRDDDAQ
jgi:bifunctional UDP-N-acetylglucosamine pyrophosphorylase/glucosamine-1-phosphate N-acetyltransferase